MPDQRDPVFEKAFRKLLGVEGGYVDNPNDSGGKTNWGITEAVARSAGYQGLIAEMDVDTAARIYRQEYWDALQLSEVAQRSVAVADELFDTAVNMGQGTAARFLQRCLNVLNRQQRDWLDMPVTGQINRQTLDALWIYYDVRKELAEPVLLRMLNCLQGARYIEIAEQRQKDEAFVFGWFNTRVAVIN